jgi:hypothetical protein
LRGVVERWSAAEAALLVGWAAIATGLLSHAWRHHSLGVLALAIFATWQLCHVWEGMQRAQ